MNYTPYVPLAPRFNLAPHTTAKEAKKAHHQLKQLFSLIDDLAQHSSLEYNHSSDVGYLAINPEHLNDLAVEHGQTRLNMAHIHRHLPQLTYPIYQGEQNIQSNLWDCDTTVWLFQLNQTYGENPMQTFDLDADATLALDKATALIKTWRKTLEVAGEHQLTYTNNDLLYSLLAIEDLLDIVVTQVEANQDFD